MNSFMTRWNNLVRRPGVFPALAAALLFGSATPLAKRLLGPLIPGYWQDCCTWGQELVSPSTGDWCARLQFA
jgi:hypothetical protein